MTSTAELVLPSGHVVLLDAEDLPIVEAAGPWRIMTSGFNSYARRMAPPGVTQLMHKLLTGFPMTDHINGNGLDNRRANLRPTDYALNQANRHRLKGLSGFRGVTRRDGGRWMALIHVNNKAIYLGLFSNPEGAARAYDAAAIAAWGEHARPNFPRPGGDSDA